MRRGISNARLSLNVSTIVVIKSATCGSVRSYVHDVLDRVSSSDLNNEYDKKGDQYVKCVNLHVSG